MSVLTRNTALNRARKLRNEPDTQSITTNMAAFKDNPEDELIKSETLRKLEFIVQNLSQRDKMLFYRSFIIVSLFHRSQLKWV